MFCCSIFANLFLTIFRYYFHQTEIIQFRYIVVLCLYVIESEELETWHCCLTTQCILNRRLQIKDATRKFRGQGCSPQTGHT